MMTDYVETVTYFCCILSVIAVISNIACLVYTKKTFNENAPYRILQIECIVTTSCQLGFFGVLLGSLQESPNLLMCISASSVTMFDHSILYITRTALSRVRYDRNTFLVLTASMLWHSRVLEVDKLLSLLLDFSQHFHKLVRLRIGKQLIDF